jgi:hypothetical protein
MKADSLGSQPFLCLLIFPESLGLRNHTKGFVRQRYQLVACNLKLF